MSEGNREGRGPENEPAGGETEPEGEAPRSAEEEQTAPGSGAPPVPEEGSPPGDEQAAEEVTEGGNVEPEDVAPSSDYGVGPLSEEAAERIPDEFRAEIERLVSLYPDKRSASIPALHVVQRRWGWCTPEGIEQAAAVMGLEPAELEAVASFYDLFHMEPAGEHRVLVCTNISCWMRGADQLLDSVCEAAGADRHGAGHGGVLNEAGDVFVSGFECLGACDIAPMASIDERYYGPLTEADGAALVDQLREGAEVLPDKALASRKAAGGPDPDPDPRVAEVESS